MAIRTLLIALVARPAIADVFSYDEHDEPVQVDVIQCTADASKGVTCNNIGVGNNYECSGTGDCHCGEASKCQCGNYGACFCESAGICDCAGKPDECNCGTNPKYCKKGSIPFNQFFGNEHHNNRAIVWYIVCPVIALLLAGLCSAFGMRRRQRFYGSGVLLAQNQMHSANVGNHMSPPGSRVPGSAMPVVVTAMPVQTKAYP